MAFELPKIDMADAKTRVLVITGGLAAFVGVVYLGVHFISNKTSAAGASKVASAPGNLQSVPGGQLTPEYYRALVQANAQAAKQAQISGGSAVPTLLNEPGAQPAFEQPQSSCTIVCPNEQNVTVDNDVNDLIKAGKLTPEEGKKLIDMAKKNVAVSAYAAQLDNLVKQGKLTPEQARKLLDDYKKQHENALLQESGKAMDDLIKSGKLPIDAANDLLELQKQHVTPSEYADKLNELVKEGKISPDTAAKLLAQYTKQNAHEAAAEAQGQLEEMAATGQITPEVAKELEDYQSRHVPLKEYQEELDHLVKQGKLTPEQAAQLLDQYKKLVPPDVADRLADLQSQNVPVAQYQAELQRLVAQGKLTPEQAEQLLDDYRKARGETSASTSGSSAMDKIVRDSEQVNDDAIRQLAESGRISPETAQKLLDLQKANVPVSEYKRQLDELVREGKISPEDAQKLLNDYMSKKNGTSASVQQLLRDGKISQETAQKLLDLQKANVPVSEYKRQLDELVREGKISPEDAQKLLNDYMSKKNGASDAVQQLLHDGKISQDTAQKLMELQQKNVPVEEYKKELDELVREGKLSPEDAQKLLNEYQQKHAGTTTTVEDLLRTRKLSPEVEAKLQQMQRANVTPEEYKRELDELVREGKITPQQAKDLMDKYNQLHALREEQGRLKNMRDSNVSVDDYANELRRAVSAGTLSPEQAAQLLQEYSNSKLKPTVAPTVKPVPSNVKGAAAFNALQAKVAAAAPTAAPPSPPVNTQQFSAAAAKARAQAEQEETQKVQNLMAGMSSQAGQLISSWQPPTMAGQTGSFEADEAKKKVQADASVKSTTTKTTETTTSSSSGPPLIKAGSIAYAVLDTGVNSDYPDTPVLATIVTGQFKGAKLLGKIGVTEGKDRVTLSFKLMNMEDWPSGKTVNAFAIDPDTARTVLASDVNYHYFLRYGALFASSFLTGYASAITNSGSTTSSGIFGTTTTHPNLSPINKMMTGFGQVGTNLGNAVQGYTTTPPTVKIDPGVSLGILFMADVS